MQTPIMTHAGPTGSAPSETQTRYAPMAAGAQTTSWTTSQSQARTPVAVAGTFADGVARFPVAILTGSFTVTLQKNGVDTSLTGTITTGTDLTLTGSATVAAGDDVCWRVTGAASTGQGPANVIQIACGFTAASSGQSVIFAAGANSASTRYMSPGAFNSASRTDNETRVPMPTAGVINSLYVSLSAAPGVGNSKVLTVHKNGSATGITVTISGAATTGNITAQNISWVQGDVINIVETIAGTPSASLTFCGLDWVPATTGEALLFSAFTSAQATGSAVYTNVNGQQGGGTATESAVYNIAPVAFTAKKLCAVTSTAPGAAKSRTFTLRKGGASQSLSAAIAGAATTTAADNSNEVSVAVGDLLAFLNNPAGTPAANTYSQISVVAYIAPAAATRANRLTTLGVS